MALPKPSRGAAAAMRNAAQRRAAALALAPVPAPRDLEPLYFGDRAAATVHVSVEPFMLPESTEVYAQDEFRAHIPEDGEYGNVGNDRAAMRHQLTGVYLAGPAAQRIFVGDGPHEFGPTCRVAVLLDDGRSFILQGTWAAIRRALPDRETVKVWKEAGATEFPLYDFNRQDEGGARRVTYVPIDLFPRVVQVEYESRALGR